MNENKEENSEVESLEISEPTPAGYFSELPYELLLSILKFLDRRDLRNLQASSRFFKEVTADYYYKKAVAPRINLFAFSDRSKDQEVFQKMAHEENSTIEYFIQLKNGLMLSGAYCKESQLYLWNVPGNELITQWSTNFGRIHSFIEVKDNIVAVVHQGGKLEVYDLQNPKSPVLLAISDLPHRNPVEMSNLIVVSENLLVYLFTENYEVTSSTLGLIHFNFPGLNIAVESFAIEDTLSAFTSHDVIYPLSRQRFLVALHRKMYLYDLNIEERHLPIKIFDSPRGLSRPRLKLNDGTLLTMAHQGNHIFLDFLQFDEFDELQRIDSFTLEGSGIANFFDERYGNYSMIDNYQIPYVFQNKSDELILYQTSTYENAKYIVLDVSQKSEIKIKEEADTLHIPPYYRTQFIEDGRYLLHHSYHSKVIYCLRFPLQVVNNENIISLMNENDNLEQKMEENINRVSLENDNDNSQALSANQVIDLGSISEEEIENREVRENRSNEVIDFSSISDDEIENTEVQDNNEPDLNQQKQNISFFNNVQHNDHSQASSQILIRLLQDYIDRIEKLPKKQNRIQFQTGFYTFWKSQGTNREANYLLAIQLRNRLQAGEAIDAVFSDLLQQREDLGRHLEKFAKRNRGINSTELNAVIKEAQHLSLSL